MNGEPIFPSYSVGWIDDETGVFEIVGTFNNNLQRLAPADFNMLVRRFASTLMETRCKEPQIQADGDSRRHVLVLVRQDAPDTVDLDAELNEMAH